MQLKQKYNNFGYCWMSNLTGLDVYLSTSENLANIIKDCSGVPARIKVSPKDVNIHRNWEAFYNG